MPLSYWIAQGREKYGQHTAQIAEAEVNVHAETAEAA